MESLKGLSLFIVHYMAVVIMKATTF